MRTFKRTGVEMVVLLVVGTTVAFAGNAWRSNHSIEWSRDYFKINRVSVPVKSDVPVETTAIATDAVPASISTAPPVAVTPEVGLAVTAPPVAEKHLQHDYQPIHLDGVKSAFNDPGREQGLIVFVDARADEPFEAGHIPGALQCDHYQLDKYIDAVKDKARVAEQVIVYCNGGPCEDSIFTCQNLLERGLAYDAVFLYEGGWKDWEKSGMPIAKGKEESP